MATLLQLTPAEIDVFTTGKANKIMDDQVAFSVTTVWAALFKLWSNATRVVSMLGLSWYLNLGNDEMPMTTKIGLCLVPLVMVGYGAVLLWRTAEHQSKLTLARFVQGDVWGDFIITSADLRPCITSYRRGHEISADFEAKHKQWNGMSFKAGTHQATTNWEARLLPTGLSAVLLVVAGREVRSVAVPRPAGH